MSATRDAIRAAVDCPVQLVEVPEWGRTVGLRGLLASEGRSVLTHEDWLDRACAAIVLGVVEPDDPTTPVFTAADMEWLREKSLRAINRLSKWILDQTFESVDAIEKK